MWNELLVLWVQFSSHPEDHLWATTVLHSSVASKLDHIWDREIPCDVVATLEDVDNFSGGFIEFGALDQCSLAVSHHKTTRSPKRNNKVILEM